MLLLVAACARGAARQQQTRIAGWHRLVEGGAAISLRRPSGRDADTRAEAAQLVAASYRLPPRAADSPEPHRLPPRAAFVAVFAAQGYRVDELVRIIDGVGRAAAKTGWPAMAARRSVRVRRA